MLRGQPDSRETRDAEAIPGVRRLLFTAHEMRALMTPGAGLPGSLPDLPSEHRRRVARNIAALGERMSDTGRQPFPGLRSRVQEGFSWCAKGKRAPLRWSARARHRVQEMATILNAASQSGLLDVALNKAELVALFREVAENAPSGPSRSCQLGTALRLRMKRDSVRESRLEARIMPVLGQFLVALFDRYPEFRARVMPTFEQFVENVDWKDGTDRDAAERLIGRWKDS